MPIFMIDTVHTFRHKWLIEAKSLEHAYDEMVMTEHNRKFDELTQKCLGEMIIDGREVTREDIDKIVASLKEDKDEWVNHWLVDKCIHKVDYTK